MWKKEFYISFEGEEGMCVIWIFLILINFDFISLLLTGIDQGGVSREFINCLCNLMFNGKNSTGLFSSFKSDDMQSLVRKSLFVM